MPWLVPSHQALVLPLKRWRPAWFSGLGLVLGTATPDLVFIFALEKEGSAASHTLTGQLLLTAPMVLALHALATILVLPWLLPHLPGASALHFHALARSRPALDLPSAVRVAFSGLLGGLTHVLLDGFTHGNHSGWAVAFLPSLRTAIPLAVGSPPLHDVLQVGLTLVLGLLAVREWQRYARALPAPGPGAAAAWEVRQAPERACRSVVRGLVLSALAGAFLAPVVKGVAGFDAVKLAAYGAIDGVCLGAVIGALTDRARRLTGPRAPPLLPRLSP